MSLHPPFPARRRRAGLAALACGWALAACGFFRAGGGTELAASGGGCASLQPVFSCIQQRIFDVHCAACHSGPAAPQGLALDAGSSFANLVGVPSAEVPSLLRVEPFNPDDSYLVRKLEGGPGILGDPMPAGQPPLDPGTIAVLRQWISDGAVDDGAAGDGAGGGTSGPIGFPANRVAAEDPRESGAPGASLWLGGPPGSWDVLGWSMAARAARRADHGGVIAIAAGDPPQAGAGFLRFVSLGLTRLAEQGIPPLPALEGFLGADWRGRVSAALQGDRLFPGIAAGMASRSGSRAMAGFVRLEALSRLGLAGVLPDSSGTLRAARRMFHDLPVPGGARDGAGAIRAWEVLAEAVPGERGRVGEGIQRVAEALPAVPLDPEDLGELGSRLSIFAAAEGWTGSSRWIAATDRALAEVLHSVDSADVGGEDRWSSTRDIVSVLDGFRALEASRGCPPSRFLLGRMGRLLTQAALRARFGAEDAAGARGAAWRDDAFDLAAALLAMGEHGGGIPLAPCGSLAGAGAR